MTDMQELLSAPEDNPYKTLSEKADKFYRGEELYGSLVMNAVILALAV